MYYTAVKGGESLVLESHPRRCRNGKSQRCYSLIQAAKEKNQDLRIVMVVPDQFSFTAEKTMTEKFSGTGPNGIEVLTFSRLIHRCLGKRGQSYMTPAGKQMLTYKAMLSAETADSPFAGSLNKQGFLDAIADMLKEFARYMVTPEMLSDQAGKCADDMLARKLTALSAVYSEFLKLTRGRFLDSEEDPGTLAAWILENDVFENTCFFFDRIFGFSSPALPDYRSPDQKSRGVCVTASDSREAGGCALQNTGWVL